MMSIRDKLYHQFQAAKRYSSATSWRQRILFSSAIMLLSLVSFLTLGSSYDELEKIMADPTLSITEFKSDGCSGGMSSVWRWLNLTDEQQHLPWLACCLAHDESYWRGGDREERLLSDQALEQCVEAKGYPLIAQLMYASVRAGGGPCTGLSWRWGYGWKDC